jgi:hypothetical protein
MYLQTLQYCQKCIRRSNLLLHIGSRPSVVMGYVHMYGLWPFWPLAVWQGQKKEFAQRFWEQEESRFHFTDDEREHGWPSSQRWLELNMGSKTTWESAASDSFKSLDIVEGRGIHVNNPHCMRMASKPSTSARKDKALVLRKDQQRAIHQ